MRDTEEKLVLVELIPVSAQISAAVRGAGPQEAIFVDLRYRNDII
jgi:predicted methyltransferase MtxX (methanogen marker protein 4)